MDPLSLVKRIPKGSGLTPGEGDQNWTDIETLANDHLAAYLVSHNDDGTLKPNVVPATAVTLAALSKGYFTDTGTANAWIVAISPTPANLAALTGIPLSVKLAAGVTGATQLTITGVGTAGVRFNGSTELRSGDYTTGQIVQVIYDGTVFQAKSQIIPATASSTEKAIGGFRNLVFQTTSTAVITVTADEAVLVNANGVHATFSAVSETADFAVADAAGGRETSMSTAAGWTYAWLIAKSDLTGLDMIFSTSATVPNIGTVGLATYANGFYLLVGAVYNSSSGSNLTTTYQVNRQAWINEANVFDDTAAAANNTYEVISGTPATTLATLVPPIAKTAFGTFGSSSTSVNGRVTVAGTADGLGAVSSIAEGVGVEVNPIGGPATTGAGFTSAGHYEVPLKTSQLFYFKAFNTSTKSRINISGWTW